MHGGDAVISGKKVLLTSAHQQKLRVSRTKKAGHRQTRVTEREADESKVRENIFIISFLNRSSGKDLRMSVVRPEEDIGGA